MSGAVDARIAGLEARLARCEAQLSGNQLVPPWMRDILQAASDEFGVTPDHLVGYGRARLTSTARNVAMLVARDHTMFSYPQIGRALGRDHTTVIHARDGVAARMREEPAFAERVARVVARFQALRNAPPVIGSTASQEALNHG